MQVGHAHPVIWNELNVEQSYTDEKFLFKGNGDELTRSKKSQVSTALGLGALDLASRASATGFVAPKL